MPADKKCRGQQEPADNENSPSHSPSCRDVRDHCMESERFLVMRVWHHHQRFRQVLKILQQRPHKVNQTKTGRMFFKCILRHALNAFGALPGDQMFPPSYDIHPFVAPCFSSSSLHTYDMQWQTRVTGGNPLHTQHPKTGYTIWDALPVLVDEIIHEPSNSYSPGVRFRLKPPPALFSAAETQGCMVHLEMDGKCWLGKYSNLPRKRRCRNIWTPWLKLKGAENKR